MTAPKSEEISLEACDETPASGDVEGKRNWKLRKLDRKIRKTFPKKRRAEDPFPDVVPVEEDALDRHRNLAENLKPEAMKTAFHQQRFAEKKKRILAGVEKTARAEILNEEDGGYLELDNGELSQNVKQSQIVQAVDVASATKHFDLNLEHFGPYQLDYSSNGRFLAIGGRKGHVAALEWTTKKLQFEINVMETVRDVKFLHTENMLAVAQKHYTYIYDNTGCELHCIKSLGETVSLEFLPHHFLLVAGTKRSNLAYLDTSVGKLVSSLRCRKGPLSVMTANPANAIIHTGHSDGTVSLWSPNSPEPLVRMLAHGAAVHGVAVDETGKYMYTTGLDRKCRVWDLRMYRQMHAYGLPLGVGKVAVSQRRVVAVAVGNTVQVFREMEKGLCKAPYLSHRLPHSVSALAFVPYEDVLGVGHDGGFSSLLIPGSGEANVDALRNNPYETKAQRKEREVKQLLDKIQPELISLDTSDINQVNEEELELELEKKKSILWLKAPQIEFTARHKAKGRGGGVKLAKNKEALQADARKQHNMQRRQLEKELFSQKDAQDTESAPRNVLDRFKRKPQ